MEPMNSLIRADGSARGSMARAKRRGENGQPCRVPLNKAKDGDKILFVSIHALGFLYRILSQFLLGISVAEGRGKATLLGQNPFRTF